MKRRIARKILKVVSEYKLLQRWDMPYNGNQIYQAAKRLLPQQLRSNYKGWRKQSVREGKNEFVKLINR